MPGRRCWRVGIMCLALLIALAPALYAFAMVPHASAGALLETPDHSASQVASQAGEAAAISTRAHQHGDESLAIDGGTCGCLAIQSIDLCTLVCCAAILSQSLDHTRVRLPSETEFLLTIPSSASRIASHPPPEAIA
jgi:hypothetical protein